jgi:hypothetical protein
MFVGLVFTRSQILRRHYQADSEFARSYREQLPSDPLRELRADYALATAEGKGKMTLTLAKNENAAHGSFGNRGFDIGIPSCH